MKTNMYKQLLKDIYSAFQKFNKTRTNKIVYPYKNFSCESATLPGSEYHESLVFRHVTIKPKSTATCEVLAGRSGAFKPRTVTIISIDSNSHVPVSVEILDVTVMGNPQLVNYSGVTVNAERGSTLFFNETRKVDWQAFGASAGQGLNIALNNILDREVEVYVAIQGDRANNDLIGKA